MTLMTVQEFLALPQVEGERRELIGGEVVSMPLNAYPHEVTKANLIQILTVWLAQSGVQRDGLSSRPGE
jgi:Uma2 family endonuclease